MGNEALHMATRRAKEHAEAITSGLGMKIGQVVSAEESSAVRAVVYSDTRDTKVGGSTPVETGMIKVSASVIVEAVLTS